VLNWTFKDGSFRTRISNEYALCPRPSGGLGILDPICQQHAIHAMWLVKILLTPAYPLLPWRSLLVLALNDAAFELAGHFNILGYDWTEKVGGAEKDLKRKKDSAPLTLAHNILRAFQLLQPRNLPLYNPAAVVYLPQLGFTRASVNLLALTERERDAIRVCKGVCLEDLTVAKAAAFIASKIRPSSSLIVPEKNTALSATPEVWKSRWTSLKSSPLPANTRQFLFRLFHGKMNWGEKKDTPIPLCPFCEQPDGLHHFISECPLASQAKRLLQECWEFWTSEAFPPDFLTNHVSKDQRWNSAYWLLLQARYAVRSQASIKDRTASWHEVIGDFRKKLSLFITLLLRPPPDGHHPPLADEWSMNEKWFQATESGQEARVRFPHLFALYEI
jgi:hypothetical protein